MWAYFFLTWPVKDYESGPNTAFVAEDCIRLSTVYWHDEQGTGPARIVDLHIQRVIVLITPVTNLWVLKIQAVMILVYVLDENHIIPAEEVVDVTIFVLAIQPYFLHFSSNWFLPPPFLPIIFL